MTEREQSGDVEAHQQQVTALLREWSSGNKKVIDELVPLLYGQLRRLAGHCLRSERPNHTLSATALVHEAYLELASADVAWQNRTHFYAVASRVLRHILVDHARSVKRQKRGGGAEVLALDEAVMIGRQVSSEILELDDALKRLAERDERKSQIVEMLFFGGMTYDETAESLQISPATVHRELKMAKAWLHRELAHPQSHT